MFRLCFSGFCGMSDIPSEPMDAGDVRAAAAEHLREARRTGHPVAVLERGAEWEIGEPEGCCMVPDSAGILWIEAVPTCAHCGGAADGRRSFKDRETGDRYCDQDCAARAAELQFDPI